ncbi:MAG: Mini-ribonuclease 3 [Oscillospiraceae bacterium]
MDYFSVSLSDRELQSISSLGLAHIGDAVFELMTRTYLAAVGKETNRSLHRATVAMVSAGAQAKAAERIMPLLTDEEREVFRRGRNAKVHAVPKAATHEQYHTATALEALFGYLYLKGRIQRLNELYSAIVEDSDVS